jgi:hypothetical protein
LARPAALAAATNAVATPVFCFQLSAYGCWLLAAGIKLAQLLAHRVLFFLQPGGQLQGHGTQATGLGQHHPQAPERQHPRLRPAQFRQVLENLRRPSRP